MKELRSTRRIARAALSEIEQAPSRDATTLRRIRKAVSKSVKALPPENVLEIASQLVAEGPKWFGYELINQHAEALASLRIEDVERLGSGNSTWGQVDAFGTLIAGPVWLNRQIRDSAVARWAGSSDFWWRRTALVATTVLNSKSRGGTGDASRTLTIVDALKRDQEDMVVKAVSWALRSLVQWDEHAVRVFLAENFEILHPRVRREVGNKLTSGLKNPRRNERSDALENSGCSLHRTHE